MKSILLSILFIPGMMHAQRWHVNVTGGLSNYSGDLQDKAYTFDQSFFAFGAGAQYDITRNFSAISNIMVIKVGAVGPVQRTEPRFPESQFSIEYPGMEPDGRIYLPGYDPEKIFTFSIFRCIAVFHYDPYAFDTLGNKIFLQPLSTEGEGLPQYPDQKPYNLTQFAIPVGGGIKFRVSENIILAYEIGFRKTFTDYLDDVSTYYVDQAILQNAKGPLAVEMAYRGNELKGGAPYPPSGTKRGSPKYQGHLLLYRNSREYCHPYKTRRILWPGKN